MSWMAKLNETYQQIMNLDLPDDKKVLPVSHTQQNSHINIVIDGEGNFSRAFVLEKTKVILPATEESAGRTSGESPYPLADKLQYVAKDYALYGGLKPSYFKSYHDQLLAWCESPHSHPKAQAVYQYIKKGRVIENLISAKIVYIDENQKLRTDWQNDSEKDLPTPLLFKVLPKEKGQLDQGAALVCWTVEIQGEVNANSWSDISLQNSWIAFEASIHTSKQELCYVSGDKERLGANHPSKIRHTGDKAKLISSNDKAGFTYRGKFHDDHQVTSISFDITQKAHNALRWLISNQGYRNGDQRIIAWAVSGKAIPSPLNDTRSFFDAELDEVEPSSITKKEDERLDHSLDLGESFALKLNKKMAGYRAKLSDFESIVIMAIDSATPGRMGITYYRECMAKEFFDRIESWHFDFAWQQRHSVSVPQPNGKKPTSKMVWTMSTPTLYSIVEATYGKAATDNLKKNLHERLIPCILEGRPFPIDILNVCIRRAANRNSGETWEWERNLGVACALYRGFYRRHPILTKRRNYSMSLETNNTSRDYLYGRLLAVAERIEKFALNISNEKRMTTAERLMQRFSDRPYSTWRSIELALKPYMQKLQANPKGRGFLINQSKVLDEIMSTFVTNDFTSDKKLTGEFLLAYHCQRQQFYTQSNNDNVTEN